DCEQLRSLTLAESGVDRSFAIGITDTVHLAGLRRRFNTSGIPRYAAVVDNTLLLVPAPNEDMTAEVCYYTRLDRLGESNLTTDLLTNHPDLYLFGALAEAEPF